MDIIRLLPDNVANQIAAGEVIQRPASCLKELVENSLDAGATQIQIIVQDAGRTLLQVIDNGSGMSETDARMAFERHATSKIREAADLFALHTMGFRGEALASICAVSQVELTTRRQDSEMGTRIEVNGSVIASQEECSCPVGTNFKVKNLFYNIPVRRKFLKTDQTELRNLLTEFYHIALVYPKVSFSFLSNGEMVHELQPGTEKQRIEAIFGRSNSRAGYTSTLVSLHTDTDLVSIRGFISKPENSGKHPQQFFFVNGRYMRHPYFQKAVTTAYSGMLPGDYQPSFFIYFDIDPSRIDVNIHPTKTEIKFADEQTVFQILMASVREALGKFTLAPTIDFNREGELEMPALSSNAQPSSGLQMVVDPNYNPFRSRSSSSVPSMSHTQHSSTVASGWDRLYTPVPASATPPAELSSPAATPTGGIQLPSGDLSDVPMWQHNGRYILLSSADGLVFVNQHRAHACVLYNQLCRQFSLQTPNSQQLLFPEIIDLTADDMVLLESILEDLWAIGFDLQQFSPASYSIQGIPPSLPASEAASALLEILHAVRETGSNVRSEWQGRIAQTLSRSMAIPYGKTLTLEEMRQLVAQLVDLGQYQLTADGKRIVSLLSDEDIRRLF